MSWQRLFKLTLKQVSDRAMASQYKLQSFSLLGRQLNRNFKEKDHVTS